MLEGKAKTSTPKTIKTFSSYIKKESILNHDSEHSHKNLVQLLELKSNVYETK